MPQCEIAHLTAGNENVTKTTITGASTATM